MAVGVNHIQVAGRLLDGIAAAGGEDVDPTVAMMMWRESVGIDSGALEIEAARSAEETAEEMRQLGDELSWPELAQYLSREYMAGFQVGFIVHARMVARAAEREEREKAST